MNETSIGDDTVNAEKKLKEKQLNREVSFIESHIPKTDEEFKIDQSLGDLMNNKSTSKKKKRLRRNNKS